MFTIKKKINFYDCDPAGILFYARLFEINHSVYEQLIDSLNLKEDYWQSDIIVVPIIKTDGEYLKPVKTGDLIFAPNPTLDLEPFLASYLLTRLKYANTLISNKEKISVYIIMILSIIEKS